MWLQRLGLDRSKLTGQVQGGIDVGCDFSVSELQELGGQKGDPQFTT